MEYKTPTYKGVDQTGRLFGKWKVLYEINDNSREKKWRCLCTGCDREFDVYKRGLLSGGTTQCKSCSYSERSGEKSPVWTGYKGISGVKYNNILKRAKQDNISFDLSIEYLWDIWEAQNGICAISGENLDLNKTASLDRIDSKKDYIKTNVWWVHKHVNMMKQNYSLDYFLDFVDKIHKNTQQKLADNIKFYQSFSKHDLLEDD